MVIFFDKKSLFVRFFLDQTNYMLYYFIIVERVMLMNSNKEILKYCPNYYNIINFDFKENDMISEKLINIYKNYIFSINIQNRDDIERVQELDRVLSNYIHDYLFRSTLQKEIVTVKVKKDNNILKSLAEIIIKIFSNYEEYTTRKIYISKWI